jgi:hypothetical protein
MSASNLGSQRSAMPRISMTFQFLIQSVHPFSAILQHLAESDEQKCTCGIRCLPRSVTDNHCQIRHEFKQNQYGSRGPQCAPSVHREGLARRPILSADIELWRVLTCQSRFIKCGRRKWAGTDPVRLKCILEIALRSEPVPFASGVVHNAGWCPAC